MFYKNIYINTTENEWETTIYLFVIGMANTLTAASITVIIALPKNFVQTKHK